MSASLLSPAAGNRHFSLRNPFKPSRITTFILTASRKMGLAYEGDESAEACRHAAIRQMNKGNGAWDRRIVRQDGNEASSRKIGFQGQRRLKNNAKPRNTSFAQASSMIDPYPGRRQRDLIVTPGAM